MRYYHFRKGFTMPKNRSRRVSSGPARYAIYLRCSSEDQKAGDYTTIDTQREINTRHIAQMNGKLVKEYADEGKSGTNLNRPGWRQLLADAQAGAFDVVLVTYMSRLGRGRSFIIAEYELGNCGVSVEMVKEKFADDMAGYVNKTMTNMMDGFYAQMCREWTLTKMEEMVAKGYVTGGYTGFGYLKEPVPGVSVVGDKRTPKRFVPDPATAPLVRRAFELFVETRRVPCVRDYLREATGQKWDTNRTCYLLRNDLYRGVIRFGQWENLKAHEPIISEELWNAAREADADRLKGYRHHHVNDFHHYLRGRVFCPHCGCGMTPYWVKGMTALSYYYQCNHDSKRLTDQCPIKRVNADSLHDVILEQINQAGQNPEVIESLMADAIALLPDSTEAEEEAQALAAQLGEVRRRITRLQEAIETGDGPMRSLVERLEELECQRVTLEKQCQDAKERAQEQGSQPMTVAEACTLLSELRELWETGDEEQREVILQNLVMRVEMETKTEGVFEIELTSKTPVLHSKLELKIEQGAGARLELATFGL
jgi:site-specific DNA recombinase